MSTAGDGEPRRAHVARNFVLDLVFDPSAEWFADVPLARRRRDGSVQVLRGKLGDRELRAVAEAGAEGLVGVFVNHVGHIEVWKPGQRFYDDPRDVHTLPSSDVYAGPDLASIATRLRTIADWLDARDAEGWTVVSLSHKSLAITDAPDRVPSERLGPPADEPVDWSGGAELDVSALQPDEPDESVGDDAAAGG